ncbi:AP2-like ethylene-responsive transcription factor PLT2 [Forsythia ovata]|uniref:AP2-like ethylene-responsive transcription factor PLT2 n=1 Tax=Forsythia ovata TaxID=205694 RepID=A0ABD1NU18_9LAMI
MKEWNLINSQENNEVPKVADFLGVGKSENHTELVPYNEIQSSDSDYMFSNNISLVPVQHSMAVATGNYNLQENPCNMQSLTLTMGSGKGSTNENSATASADNRGYDKEEKAARAYDLAALKYWGTSTTTNFPALRRKQQKHMM